MQTTAAKAGQAKLRFLHVAVGVVEDGRGQVLIARRRPEKHQGGLWEFPGGKLEAGESAESALARELKEEVGITVDAAQAFMRLEHEYSDVTVLLDVWRVTQFRGEPQALEGQPLRWAALGELDPAEFPEANQEILEALRRGASSAEVEG